MTIFTKKTILFLLILLFFSFFLAFVSTVNAERINPQNPVELTNPLGAGVTTQTFIGKIIKAILGIVGSLALVMFTP